MWTPIHLCPGVLGTSVSGFVRIPVSDWGLDNSLSGCHQHTLSAFLLLLLFLGCPDAPWVGPRLKCAFPLLEGVLAIGADCGGGLSMGTPPADPRGPQGEDAPCSRTAPAQSFSSDFTACCKIHSSTPGPHLRRSQLAAAAIGETAAFMYGKARSRKLGSVCS